MLDRLALALSATLRRDIRYFRLNDEAKFIGFGRRAYSLHNSGMLTSMVPAFQQNEPAMGIIIAFRIRPFSSADIEAAAPAIAGHKKRGVLIIFPGADFSRVLPALRADRTANTRKTD